VHSDAGVLQSLLILSVEMNNRCGSIFSSAELLIQKRTASTDVRIRSEKAKKNRAATIGWAELFVIS